MRRANCSAVCVRWRLFGDLSLTSDRSITPWTPYIRNTATSCGRSTAHALAAVPDEMVRETPEEAYEPSFFQRLSSGVGWRLGGG